MSPCLPEDHCVPNKFIYLPRADISLIRIVEEWNETRSGLENEEYISLIHEGMVLIHGKKSRPLEKVQPEDRLYVFGHGNLGQGIGPSNRGLTAKELARRIQKDGLHENHPEIRLFACNTAVKMHNQVAPYAERLAKAMWNRGYHGTQIIGYIGFLSFNNVEGKKESVRALKWGPKQKPKRADSSVWPQRAKDKRVTFSVDEDGNVSTDSDERYVGQQTQTGWFLRKTTIYRVVAVNARPSNASDDDDEDYDSREDDINVSGRD
jgi:hypothetical protein